MGIALCTLNAKYLHASLGLRWLYANMGELKPQTDLLEFDINQPLRDVVEAIAARAPRIIGFGVYIWNVEQTLAVVRMLKALDPSLVVVVGGPEVSHETDAQPIAAVADHVIQGEADLAFAALCRERLAGRVPPHVVKAPLPELGTLTLPWDEYTPHDLAHRLLYVEASRGCPYRCEFCLSSLDEKVRVLPPDAFFAAMQRLLDRGARTFKFVDRTFNLDLKHSRRVLEFFLERLRPGLFLHFEMVPDRLPPDLREVIARFPPGALQFEIGIQTFNPDVERNISRRQDHAKLEDNLRWLVNASNVHVHADLIAGLPREDLESFARGFDRLVALGPHEIQVGILKRLNGAPIARHAHPLPERGEGRGEGESARERVPTLVFSPVPPYEVLKTSTLSFEELNALRRFARTWDLFANSGDFKLTFARVLPQVPSAFVLVRRLSERVGSAPQGIALTRRFRFVFELLVDDLGLERREAAELLLSDYRRVGKSDRPTWLDSLPDPALADEVLSFTARQARHRAAP